MAITIQKSETADTRTCDYANVSKETLLASSKQHISDVCQGIAFFQGLLTKSAQQHDVDKLTDIDGFHADFLTGFKQTGWWDRHRKLNRHHLLQADGIPDDVNLIDVIDFIVDCVMAGMARSGSVYPLPLPTEVLAKAFHNTVELLKENVVVSGDVHIDPPEFGTPLLCIVCAYVKPWGVFSSKTGAAVCVECRDKARAQ